MSRLFFALQPPAAIRRQIDALTVGQPPDAGRRVPMDNLHMTLAFLGQVDAGQRDCIVQRIDRRFGADVLSGQSTGAPEASIAECRSCPMRLDFIDFWARPRVLWLGASDVPESLAQLADSLAAEARLCEIDVDSRPWQAHITLMRKARPHQIAVPQPIVWLPDHFALMESVSTASGVRYPVVKSWGLP